MVVVNGGTNGGYRSYNEIVHATAENMFANTFMAERETGSTVVRFGYATNHSTNDETAFSMLVWIDNETVADDYVYFSPMSQGATQSGIVGNEAIYTVANLSTDASSGGTTLVVTTPTPAAADTFSRTLTDAYQNGRMIRVTDKAYPDSGTGNEEFHTINGAPGVVGQQVTMTTTNQLANAYTVAGGARVSVVYECGNVLTAKDAMTETSTSGTIDDTTYPPTLNNQGCIEETWTFTFSDANNFSCSGARVGAVGSGTISSTFAPTNPDSSTAYFSINPLMWGGTWANTETAELVTYDPSENFAFFRITPANAGSQTANRATVVIACES